MMEMPESKHKLLAVIVLLVALMLLLFLLVLPTYSLFKDTQEQLASLQHRLTQYKALSSKSKGLSNKLTQLQAFNDDQEYYFEYGKAALVSAELQGILKDILNRHDAKIVSTQPVTNGNIDERQIKISIHCRVDINDFQGLLYTLETHMPILIIDKINISRAYRTTASIQKSINSNELLDIRFDTSGFLAANEAAP